MGRIPSLSSILPDFAKAPSEERAQFLASLSSLLSPSDWDHFTPISQQSKITKGLLDENSSSPTVRLPNESLALILTFLHAQASDLRTCTLINRRWNRVLQENSLWKVLCLKRYAKHIESEIPASLVDKEWKARYRFHHTTEMNWRKGKGRKVSVDRGVPSLSMGFSGSLVVSVSQQEPGVVWDLSTRQVVMNVRGHAGIISAVTLDAQHLLSGSSDATLKIWNVKSGECVRTLQGHTGEISAVYANVEFIVTASEDGTLRIWNRSNGECVRVLSGHQAPVTAVHGSHQYIVSGSEDGKVFLWSNTADEPSKQLIGHTEVVFCVQMNAEWVVSGSQDTSLRLWDPSTGMCKRVLRGHQCGITCVQMDESKIVSGSLDCSVRVWDLATGKCLYALPELHQSALWKLYFDETRIISSSLDHNLVVYDFSASGKSEPELESREA